MTIIRNQETESTITGLAELSELIGSERISALVQGNYPDVYSILGMHKHQNGRIQVSVFLPGAKSVWLVERRSKHPVAVLTHIHHDGLFSVLIERKRKFSYQLQVQYPDATLIIDDPYSIPSLLDEKDCYLFNNGSQERAYHFLGANHRNYKSIEGVLFATWAPNARRVSVVGDFNFWDGRTHVMRQHQASGIWEVFIPNLCEGSHYKFEIIAKDGKLLPLKADPYARSMQLRPDTASVVSTKKSYEWNDVEWMKQRKKLEPHMQAMSIYEVHLGSWRRNIEQDNCFLNYRELAKQLVCYVKELGFTHIQLLPIAEHPFDGSWGYQPLGMFAPTSRFGQPEEFKYFIDFAHQNDIGILLDWVPAHFPNDEHGLSQFDGTHLYEHSDPRKGLHPDWDTLIYNYSRAEVCSFLISNVFYWLDQYHLDGIRFDAVASMLYLDYSRKDGEWIPNYHGGRENLEAVDLIRTINSRAYFNFPGVVMIAEESTAWPGVTDLVDKGGLGFGLKWNLGWMSDSLNFVSRDPIHRKFHHNEITFGLLYAFSENFILPLSHDEVVHGKRSIIERIPGTDQQKFSSLRAYYCYMWTHPGKKLLFMGNEFAQRDEWAHDHSLDWHLLEHQSHQQIQALVAALNKLYKSSLALFEIDNEWESFEWIDADNHANSMFIYQRQSRQQRSIFLVVINFSGTAHENFMVGVPTAGSYREIMNTNSSKYGGNDLGNKERVTATHKASHGREWSINITIPFLSALIFTLE